MKPGKLIVALDVSTLAEAEHFVQLLGSVVDVFKVGLQLFSAEGPKSIEAIRRQGASVFLDLKLHDIPNTAVGAAGAITGHGVSMFTVHAAGGYEMLSQTAQATMLEASRLGITAPTILGVTLLTSLDDGALRDELLSSVDTESYVTHMALLCKRAGLGGVIASPKEIHKIRSACGPDFQIVTPGVRPLSSGPEDQRRVATPREAIRAGADYLVIGRPILAASDPLTAAQSIRAEMVTGRQ